MAGSLIKIAETTVSSAVASVTLTGIDSTYDVYMVRLNNVIPDTDATSLLSRVTISGSADTSANYDRASKGLKSDATFSNFSATNDTKFDLGGFGTGGNESANGILYCFNFNSTSEYAFITKEISGRSSAGNMLGVQGGGVFTSTGSARDGIQFFFSSGNVNSGSFVLYGLKK